MSKFTPTAEYSTEFEGDTVTMKIGRMKRADQQTLVPFIGDVDEHGVAKMTFKDQAVMGNAMMELLPKYVTDFAGLKDASGDAITLKDAIEEVYFQGLISQILAELLVLSNIGKLDAKKS